MLLNNIKPSKPLQSFVRFYRIIDFDFSCKPYNTPNVKAYRPRIEHCLQFTPFDNENIKYPDKKSISHKVALFGQHTVMTQRNVGKRFLNLQVIFQPGILHAMLKIPIDELTNAYVDGELFFGNNIQHINERIAISKSYEEMITTVERFLYDLMKHKPLNLHPINQIANLINATNNDKSIEWYANQANLCYRQFDRAFKANTGILPKDFRTLVKLDAAYLIKNRNPQKDWLSIALESGFYDYQHLCKNLRKYTGYSPTEFYDIEQNAPERQFGDFEQ